MFVIGITGGIGSGKSTVASILRSVGIPVIDADSIAHDLTSKASETTRKVAEALGPEVLREDGSLDRKRVADMAFSNKRLLDSLSAIVHEDVILAMEAKRRELEGWKTRVVALDVPIPVRRGFLDVCDQVWSVASEQGIRLQRLKRRGMGEEEALRRMQVQMTREEYRDLAQYEIVNDGSLIELEKEVLGLLRRELGQRGIRLKGLPLEDS